MATQVQFRRGTTSQNNAFTGAQGEFTVDTEQWTIRIHDGTTVGGRQVPTLTATQTFTNKTMGSNTVWNGNAIGLGYGGTGAALTGVAGAIVYSQGSSFGLSLAGSSGQVLTSGGTSGPTWVNASALSTGTATTATTATNIAGGSAGYLMYQADANTTGFIAPGATGYVLRSTGASTAPDWVNPGFTIGTTAMTLGSTYTAIDGMASFYITGTTDASSTTTGVLRVAGGVGIAKKLYVGSDLAVTGNTVITGNLTVNGTTTTVNSTTITIDDKNIELGSVATPTDTTANGGGITLKGDTDKTIIWDSSNSNWTSSEHWNIASGKQFKIANTKVLEATKVLADGQTSITIGDSATTTAIGSTSSGTTTIGYDANVKHDLTVDGDVQVKGGDLTTNQTTFNLLNTTATTLNVGGASTTTNIGSTSSGTTTVGYDLTVNGDVQIKGGDLTTNQTTFNVINTTATTVNAFGAGTTISIGAATGTLTVNNAQTVFNSVKSVQLPVGTTAQRPTGVTGQVRYNTDLSTFEGYAAASWGSLGGVKSVDQKTYILAEATVGAGDNTLYFYNDNTNTATLTTTTAHLLQTTESTAYTNGALIVDGGVGIAKQLRVHGNATLDGTLSVTGHITAEGVTSTGATGTGKFVFDASPSIGNPTITGHATIEGVTVTGATGTGRFVFDNSPTLITPVLGAATATTILVGSDASLSDYPNSKLISSNGTTSNTEPYIVGVVGEGVASGSDSTQWGVGVYGAGTSKGSTKSAGVIGKGIVFSTSDTGSAVGVRGLATDTHASGLNVGLYADASGSALNNYALYMNTGDIFSGAAQTWLLKDNVSSALSLDATGKTGILKVITTDGAEGVTMSGTLGVTGVATLSSNASVGGTLQVTGNQTNTGDLAVNGGDITTTSTTATLFNTNATTLNIGGGATTMNIGATSSGSAINVGKDLYVAGNLYVTGTQSTGSIATVSGADSAIYVNAGATGNIHDIGLIGEYKPAGTTLYTGLLKDHTDATWKFYSAPTNNPVAGTTQSFTGATYDAVKMGALTATNGTFSAALTYGGVTLSNSVTGTGSMVLSASPTITGHPTIEGVTSTGATGTGKFVFDASPTITGHPTIEGVTSTGATGTGAFVFGTSPSLTTPSLGVASATSINKMAITAPATGSTLAVADGKTFTVNNTITLAGTDSTTITLPSTTGTVALNNQTFYLGTTSIAINRSSASQSLTGITSIDGSAATLTTARSIYGNNFDGSAALTQVIASTYGGTGNGFTKFTGPTTSEKTFTLPDASATLATTSNKLSVFAATSSSELAGIISDETGSGSLVFGTSPTITTSLITDSSTFALVNTTATTVNFAGAATTLNIGAASGATTNLNGTLALKGSSSGSVKFVAPAAAGTATYTLPSADGTSGYALVTNGSGTLSWAAAGATLSDDTSTTTLYPTMSTSSSGSLTTAKISSSKLTFNASTGTLSTVALTETSSERFKTNITPLNNALGSVLQLNGVNFDWIDAIHGTGKQAGLIAEQVAPIIPEVIEYDQEGNTSGIQYTKLIAYLIESIKDQQKQIDELKAKLGN